MIEGCLLLVWAFLLLTSLLWEAWVRRFGVQRRPPAADVRDEQPNPRNTCAMDDCESSARGGGEEKSEGVAPVDGSAFSLQELHLQLKQMECMIKMLLPYKEKLEAMYQLPSTEETTCKLGCVSEGDLSLSDLCGRLKVLESENQSLLIENGSQRLKFERCLDQVAIHVAHVLLAQQTLRGECLHLHQRVLRLEQQNEQLFKFFQRQLEALHKSKEQDAQSPREHIYEIPEFFQREPSEDSIKCSPDDKVNSSSSMYDSLEAGFPSAHCSASWNPAASSLDQIQFGVRSRTIPPYTSPRSRSHCTRCAVDTGCRGNYRPAAHDQSCSKKDCILAECETIEDFGASGVQRKVCRSRSGIVDRSVSTDLEEESLGMKHRGACGVETQYSNLLEGNRGGNFASESMESSVNDVDLSPAADLLCLSDSFYEQFTIGNCGGGQLSVSKKRGEFCIESDDKETEEFCIESDDTLSTFHGSGPLTRASSVSLSELLGRTPNMTSDSDTLSVDDYPFLDYRAKGSIIEENSNEDSDYEELIADDDAFKSQRDFFRSDVENTPSSPGVKTVLPSGIRKNKETLSPSMEQSGESLSPAGGRSMGSRGHSNSTSPVSTRLAKQLPHGGPHINVLSRCSNKKLKSAADKIFSASYRCRPTRAFHDDSDRYSTGSTSPLDRHRSKDPERHPTGTEKERETQSRPSFLKISDPHRHPVKSPADGRKETEELSPAFLPSGDFLWDERFLAKSSVASPTSDHRSKAAAASTHTYINISALNLKQKPRPLLARRKMNPPSCRTTLQGFSKRGCSRSVELARVQQRKVSPLGKTVGDTLSRTGSIDSSPDSDVQQSFCTSSSDSETVTGEKLPSSQDDGYSSNSLPSETSMTRQPVEMGRLRRPSKRDEQRGFVRRKTGGIQKIVPILGSREDLSTFEESCEGKLEVDGVEVDFRRVNLGDDDDDSDGNVKPIPFSVSVDVDSRFIEETDSLHKELPALDENSDNRIPVQELLDEDKED